MKQAHPYFTISNNDDWKKHKNLSRESRQPATNALNILWQELRFKKLGQRFLRQQAIGIFTVDFLCPEKLLIIEVDGSYDTTAAQDAVDEYRESGLKQTGYTLLHFTDDEVLNSLTEVLSKIEQTLKTPQAKVLPVL